MCLAFPLKILTVDGKTAVGEAGGIRQTIRADLVPDLAPGDYAMVHAGFAIQKMSEADAAENLAFLQEVLHES